MPRVEDLIDMDDPGLARAGEGITNLYAKIRWAAHHLINYEATDDIADLCEAERIIQEMQAELAKAQRAISARIQKTAEMCKEASLFGEDG